MIITDLIKPRWIVGIGILGGIGGTWYYEKKKKERLSYIPAEELSKIKNWTPPSRNALINKLYETPHFDLLVIGGGATGTGCALDAASRGLKVVLVEKGDFAGETSSRSTKLIHGGIRYLEKAFKEFDWEQYKLVREALQEREIILKIAPHVTEQLPIMLPIYNPWTIPYYWAGAKIYDLISGSKGLENSYFLNKNKALKVFPMLRERNLYGAMVYYDGISNDARMNISLALTSIYYGAISLNYFEAIKILKDKDTGIINGAIVKNVLNGEEISIKCSGIVNATGPFCDNIRRMDDPNCTPLVTLSSGSHIMFPNYYGPRQMGLVDPATSDGRVIFFLPWQGNVIAGTTDTPSSLQEDPVATDADINFILREVSNYLDPMVKVRKSDILAAWTGLRPLIIDPLALNTQQIVRHHLILASPGKLLTIAGGKWTTYRKMAQDTIDTAIEMFKLKPNLKDCHTEYIPLIGAHGYHPLHYVRLIQQFGFESDVAEHLTKTYGDRAFLIANLSEPTNERWPIYGHKLISWYPYIEEEIRYACRYEYAQTISDILSRRTRLSFLSCQAAYDVIDKVSKIMKEEMGWSMEEEKDQRRRAELLLKSMGLESIHLTRSKFQKIKVHQYKERFRAFDFRGSGHIPLKDAINLLREITGKHDIDWIQLVRNINSLTLDTIDLPTFLEAISTVKELKESVNASNANASAGMNSQLNNLNP